MSSRSRLALLVAAAASLVLSVLLSVQMVGTNGASGLVSVLTNPLLIALATAVLLFLIVERWKNLETQVNDLRKQQMEALKEIRNDADTLVRSKLEDTVRRAQAIENRVTNLLDEHPWVADISELETIPDSPMCRLILATAQEMYTTDRVLLCYEYLSSVASPKSDRQLEGTARDFINLSTFCEVWLDDEYLAYRIMMAGLKCSTAASGLLPYCVRAAVRHGDRRNASQLSKTLRLQIEQPFWRRIFGIQEDERMSRRDAEAPALAALSVYEAAFGRFDRAERFLRRVRNMPPGHAGTTWIDVAELELNLMLGRTEEANSLADRVATRTGLDGTTEVEVIRALRSAGLAEQAAQREKRLEEAMLGRLHEQRTVQQTTAAPAAGRSVLTPEVDLGPGEDQPDPTTSRSASTNREATPGGDLPVAGPTV